MLATTTKPNLVSVIIPAYNAEAYIEKCVCSVLQQSYSHLEIIIVNDGSKDKTLDILRELSKKDKRIKIFNRQNSGVSASRNFGIINSEGEYIVFIDADDYIASDYIEYMLSLISRTDSEFCLSKNCYKKINDSQIKTDSIEVLNKEEAVALLLSPRLVVGCWNKIFKKEILIKNNIFFPEDLFYGEGLYFITSVAQFVNKIGVGNKKVYFYRKNNTNSATSVFDIKKIKNGNKSLKNIEINLTCKTKKIRTMLLLRECTDYLGAVIKIKEHKLMEIYKKEYKEWLKYIRRHLLRLLSSKYISLYRKCFLTVGCVSPWLIMKIYQKKKKKEFKNSV